MREVQILSTEWSLASKVEWLGKKDTRVMCKKKKRTRKEYTFQQKCKAPNAVGTYRKEQLWGNQMGAKSELAVCQVCREESKRRIWGRNPGR